MISLTTVSFSSNGQNSLFVQRSHTTSYFFKKKIIKLNLYQENNYSIYLTDSIDSNTSNISPRETIKGIKAENQKFIYEKCS